MTIAKIKLNFIAILVTGITAFMLSILWYSPLMFGKIWELYRNPPNLSIPQWTMLFAPLREIIASYVIAILIYRLEIKDWKATTSIMLLLWLAFQAVGMAGAILWDNMQWQLGAVHAGDWLMKMLFMGITLTLWKNKTRKEY
ncbi:MAG: DUF1761 domain-containing protein [Bacteroidales bacterium]|nr:DUF1761 domain-containing protein [Bacteroidales bacterium]